MVIDTTIDFSKFTSNGYADFWYYEKGLNVFPADGKAKKPFLYKNGKEVFKILWEQYENEPIPESVFKEWKEKGFFEYGMAVICGQVFRGKKKGLWLNVIDCDNSLGIITVFPEGIENESKNTLVEQHANKEKGHFYFLSEKPMTTVAPAFTKELRDVNKVPAIEVKANGKQIVYCANSIHKDDSRLEIIGTGHIKGIRAEDFDKKIEKIQESYAKWNEGKTSSEVFDAYTIPFGEMVKGSFYVRGHGFNRQMVLLRYLVYIKTDNPGINESQLLDFGRKFNKKHFEIKLDDNDVKVKTESALNFGAKVALDRLTEEIKRGEAANEKKKEEEQKSNEDDDDVEYVVTDPKRRKTTIKLPFITRTIKDKVTTYDIDRLARSIIEQLYIKTVFGLEKIYYYSIDEFFEGGEMLVLNICEECIETCAQRDASEVVKKIKRISYIKIEEINKKHEGYLYPLNGILNIETKELRDYTPDDFILNKMPIIYDPKATCPKIIKFLTDCLPNKRDRHTILEGLAACHIPELRLEKAFMNLGGGNNGKSLWLYLMECYLGSDNCCNISIHDIINSRFKVTELFGSVANMYAEIAKKEIKELEKFKMVVSGDRILVERKNKDPFKFYPKARHFFSVNRLPQIDDDTDAVFRRFIIIVWRQQFTSKDENITSIVKKADIDLNRKITTPQELSGLLNIMLGLAAQLKKNKKYTHEKSTDDVRKEWLTESNNVVKFALHLEIEEGWIIMETEMYRYYCKLCKANKETPETMADFYAILKNEIPQIDFTRIQVPGSNSRIRYVQNIRMKSEKANDIGMRNPKYKKPENTSFDDILD